MRFLVGELADRAVHGGFERFPRELVCLFELFSDGGDHVVGKVVGFGKRVAHVADRVEVFYSTSVAQLGQVQTCIVR